MRNSSIAIKTTRVQCLDLLWYRYFCFVPETQPNRTTSEIHHDIAPHPKAAISICDGKFLQVRSRECERKLMVDFRRQ
jgi:hypothetical protein